jgi:hypothetical protein
MEPVSQRERFETAKERFAACSQDSRADSSLRTWVSPSDRYLPSIYLDCSLRSFLETPFSQLETTRGIGARKLGRLLQVMDRAVSSLEQRSTNAQTPATSTNCPVVGEPPGSCTLPKAFDPDGLDEKQWQTIATVISQHQLGHYPIARFARSLRDLPPGLWHERLDTFTTLFLSEIRRTTGYGKTRIAQVTQIAFDLASYVVGLPAESHYRAQVLPSAILEVTHWIEQVLAQEDAPSVDEIRERFLIPLVRQIEIDVSPEVARMIERRLGVYGEAETLDQIAADYGLTRERIRQLTARTPETLRLRWPEGRHVLDEFYEKFRNSSAAERQLQLVRLALDQFFAASTNHGASPGEVLRQWEGAGRRKLTPMTEMEICCWLAGAFPELPPATGLKWIKREAPCHESADGAVVYFSTDTLDAILHDTFCRGTATALSELVQLEEKDERNIRSRISHDHRFVEDDDRRFLPTDRCSFARVNGAWHVVLEASRLEPPVLPTLPVESLGQSLVSALLEAGIADATVWGVHRYANLLLGKIFKARLPEVITPFILGDKLVALTNGLIRPMRRRRLRWDSLDHPIRARGKRGWVSYVVHQHGVPITLEELGDLLRERYQDYAPYVLTKTSLSGQDEEGEGEFHCGAIHYPGIPRQIPPLLIPGDWELDPTEDNVSDEVKRLVTKLVLLMREGAVCDADLADAPWLLELARRHSYGELNMKSGSSETTIFSMDASPSPRLR